MVRCMSDLGWEVEANADGSWSTIDGIPAEQNEQFEADAAQCESRYGYDIPPQVSRNEAERYFEALLEAAECVRSLGFQVPEPPSRQSFVSSIVNGELPSWNPYERLVASASRPEIEGVFEECPQP